MSKITFKDFQKLDLRIGTVVKAEVPKWSHWVIRLTVDFGKDIGERSVFAGMINYYKPEEFVGKQYPFLVNLEPKKIGPEGDFSEAMLIAASLPAKSGKEEDEKPILLVPGEEVPSGTKVR